MVIYGVALLSACFLAGNFLGEKWDFNATWAREDWA